MGDLSELALGNEVVNVKDKTARNHISNGDIHVTSAQKTTWSNKYDKPGDGIPKSHLASAVQNLLTAAETALQPSDLTTLEEKVAALEAYFSSESDADNIINKWNEIVAFLSGIGEASTLSGLLSDISGQIPTALSQLSGDATHRTVTDAEKSTWNGKQDTISDLSTIRSNAQNGNTAYGWGDHAQAGYVKQAISKTYAEIKTLRDNGQLVAGQWYRITDYQTTTVQTDTQSAGHQFDIIVRADSANKLNENAFAALHSGDTYFSTAGARLEAWELKYCLDNDEIYGWADTEDGKGVIYWMKDEWGNECGYDFKNIMFKRYKTTKSGAFYNAKYYGFHTDMDGDLPSGATQDKSDYKWFYTFTRYTGSYATIKDGSLTVTSDCYFYNNVIPAAYDPWGDYGTNFFLNNIVFETNSGGCYGNTFGSYCFHCTIGNECYNNSIGNSFYQNTIGNNFYGNTIGNECYNNSIGNNFQENSIGNWFCYNTIGNYFQYNTIGNNFGSNTIGNWFCYNTIGNSCNNIIFQKSYVYNVIVENGNQYIEITSTQTTSGSNVLRNFTIAQGVNNTDTTKTISHDTVNDTFQTTYQPQNSQVVSV